MIVTDPLLPWMIDTAVGEAAIAKSGAMELLVLVVVKLLVLVVVTLLMAVVVVVMVEAGPIITVIVTE